jgi:hypothetical protein
MTECVPLGLLSPSCRVHPLAALTILEHFQRRLPESPRVVGTLLGSILPDGAVEVRTAVPVAQDDVADEECTEILLQHELSMVEQALKVSPTEVRVGLYEFWHS